MRCNQPKEGGSTFSQVFLSLRSYAFDGSTCNGDIVCRLPNLGHEAAATPSVKPVMIILGDGQTIFSQGLLYSFCQCIAIFNKRYKTKAQTSNALNCKSYYLHFCPPWPLYMTDCGYSPRLDGHLENGMKQRGLIFPAPINGKPHSNSILEQAQLKELLISVICMATSFRDIYSSFMKGVYLIERLVA
jgi:hypothetical protein